MAPGRGSTLALVAWTLWSWAQLSTGTTYTTVSDVKDAMYEDQQYRYGCYKLLNATGAVGCEAPNQQQAKGILMLLADMPEPLEDDRVIVLNVTELEPFLLRLLSEQALQEHVVGVLVDPRGNQSLASMSAADPFPLSDYALYPERDYVWNPAGTGLARQYIGRPMYMLSKAGMAEEVVGRAQYNARQDFFQGAALNWGMLDLAMWATANSSNCIANSTCLPLGGYSVWAAMPPVAGPAGLQPLPEAPITMVVAQVDSNGLFHDGLQASNAPLSGLVAMLTAMTIISNASDASAFKRRLAFAALAAEPWGYAGSRRLLFEAELGSWNTEGLDLDRVEHVIELGQLGMASPSGGGGYQLYAHSQRGPGYGDPSDLLDLLQRAAANSSSSEPKVTISPASPSTPGLPPSSLMSFLRVRPGIKGLVLADYDKQYTSPWVGSLYDTPDRVTGEALAAAAVALARGLYHMAWGGNPPELQVNTTAVQEMVSELMACMMADAPGMSCPLAYDLINPGYEKIYGVVSYAPKHYIGVVPDVASDIQNPYLKPDLTRFLWNLMGSLAAVDRTGAKCDPVKNKCQEGQMCIGWKSGTSLTDPLGTCMTTTTHYVITTSPYLYFYGGWRLVENDNYTAWQARYGWPDDPLWTESNWPYEVPKVEVFMREPYGNEVGILVAGLLLMLVTGLASYYAKREFHKHLKRQ